jgi:hypothetical protein
VLIPLGVAEQEGADGGRIVEYRRILISGTKKSTENLPA